MIGKAGGKLAWLCLAMRSNEADAGSGTAVGLASRVSGLEAGGFVGKSRPLCFTKRSMADETVDGGKDDNWLVSLASRVPNCDAVEVGVGGWTAERALGLGAAGLLKVGADGGTAALA